LLVACVTISSSEKKYKKVKARRLIKEIQELVAFALIE
jgi:hypothetical protein